MKPEEFAVLLYVSCLFFGAGFIYQAYIAGPGKTILEGLSDWYHESDNDI